MRQRAVVVAPWFAARSGGAEVALLKIAEGLRFLGYDVEFYTTRSRRPYGDWLENPDPSPGERYADFDVRRFPVDRVGFDRYRYAVAALSSGRGMPAGLMEDFFTFGMTSSGLVEALRALPEDVLIIGGPYYQALLHNVVAALPGRVVIMPAFHDEPPFHSPAVNRLLKGARAVLFLTESEKRLAIRYHGGALSRQKLEAPVLSLPQARALQPTGGRDGGGLVGRLIDGPYLLYIGRIDEGKNVRQLMQWHQEANTSRREAGAAPITLLMAGTGPDTAIRNAFVRQLGFVSEEQKRELIEDSLAVVNLSLNESFSFVIFEAWQLGVPVLVHTDCEVMRDHIEASGGGFHCRSPSEYEAAIHEFERPELRNVLGRNGSDYADKVCEINGFLSRLAALAGTPIGCLA